MQDLATKTIKEIAVENPSTVRVFEQFKIDYCCGGGKKFDEACVSAGAEPDIVKQKIREVIEGPANLQTAPEKLSAPELIDHILEQHHVYTKNEIERLIPLMQKVVERHSRLHPELVDLDREFTALCNDLLPHMQKEEKVLFPFIKQLYAAKTFELAIPTPPFGTVANPVRMMMSEHDIDGEILRRMREVTKGYEVPEGACTSFRALYFGLEELEKDLHKHIHLENNVLFPQAVELEKHAFSEAKSVVAFN